MQWFGVINRLKINCYTFCPDWTNHVQTLIQKTLNVFIADTFSRLCLYHLSFTDSVKIANGQFLKIAICAISMMEAGGNRIKKMVGEFFPQSNLAFHDFQISHFVLIFS